MKIMFVVMNYAKNYASRICMSCESIPALRLLLIFVVVMVVEGGGCLMQTVKVETFRNILEKMYYL